MTTRPPCRDRRQLLASTTGSSEGRQRASRLITLLVQLLYQPGNEFERLKKLLSRNVQAFITHNNAFLRTRGRGGIDNSHPGLLIIGFTLHWRLLIADSTPNGEVSNGFQPESRLIRSSSSRQDI